MKNEDQKNLESETLLIRGKNYCVASEIYS